MNYVLAVGAILGMTFVIAQSVTQATVRNLNSITFTSEKNVSVVSCDKKVNLFCHS